MTQKGQAKTNFKLELIIEIKIDLKSSKKGGRYVFRVFIIRFWQNNILYG